jgi:hypothetical protein
VAVLGQHQHQHGHHQDAGNAQQSGAAPRLGQNGLEQVQGELRQENGEHGRPARPQIATTAVVQPLREVPETGVACERRKEQPRAIGPPAQQNRDRDGEAEHTAEQRGSGTEIQGGVA